MKTDSDRFKSSSESHDTPTVAITINNLEWQLPVLLKALADQIEDAKEILDCEFDWDDDQGMPTDIETFQNAINFVVDYSVRIFQTQNTILSTPYIDIMKDGAISVHWETEKGQLFIIFDRNESPTRNGLAYFMPSISWMEFHLKVRSD